MQPFMPPAIEKITVARNFSRAAKTYDKVAVLQREIGERLLERLEFFNPSAQTILDLGSGTGFFTQRLMGLFPKAQILSLDIAEGMLIQARSERLHPSTSFSLCADAHYLPIAKKSIDLIFSNCTLQWCQPLPLVFQELKRILAPEGLFVFSTFGPDTLQELYRSFDEISRSLDHNNFLDMHDIGDMLLHNQFLNPVMDRDIFTLTYPTVKALRLDLKMMGAHKSSTLSKRPLKKDEFIHMNKAYEAYRVHNVLPATFEVIYGAAMLGQKKSSSCKKGKKIPLLQL